MRVLYEKRGVQVLVLLYLGLAFSYRGWDGGMGIMDNGVYKMQLMHPVFDLL